MPKVENICIDCGAKRTAYKPAKRCRRCHLIHIAPLGAQAVIRRHGPLFFIEKIRSHRLANPSNLERILHHTLDTLTTNPAFTHNYEVILSYGGHNYLIDVVLTWPHTTLAIEVNGTYYHNQPKQQTRDKRKQTAIQAHYDALLVIPEPTITADTFPNWLQIQLNHHIASANTTPL